MIDPSLFTVESLLKALLDARDRPWLDTSTIIPKYMPPYPRADTQPSCVVCYTFTDPRDGAQEQCFLRYSKGPKQGHLWDTYGDDYQSPEIALLALLEAPPPPPIMGSYLVHKHRILLGPKA
jgi:hypothetical protein